MGETTLGQAVDDYKNIYMAYRNFAERTRVEYQNDLENLAKYLKQSGIENVAGLSLPLIERYVAQLEQKGFASLTRKRKAVAIRSFLLFLYQDGYIDSNIAAKVVLPFTENRAPHILTESECDRLRTACTANPRDLAIILMLLQTGIRLSELTGLTVNDLDFGANPGTAEWGSNYVRVMRNGRRSERLIPFGKEVRSAIQNYLATRRDRQIDVLFLNRFGEPLGERGVQKAVRSQMRKSGIGGATVHTLRHTFGAQKAAIGISMKAIRKIMGLRDNRSTGEYSSTNADHGV